jgi:single-strand DNA-binding protein
MNNITVAGTLGKDCEIKQTANGNTIANFSVADSMGRDKGTIWWNCQLWGKRAEALSSYLVKGQAVTVSGTVTEREWTDKEGSKRKSIDINVNDVALQGGRRESSEPQQERRSPKQQQSFDDQDIPF